jgi:hypothetical protein
MSTQKQKLKVYGWTGARRGQVPGHGQTREIIAAKSAAEARRITGINAYTWRQSADETGNEQELAVALAKPGVVFWQPLNRIDGEEWSEVTG